MSVEQFAAEVTEKVKELIISNSDVEPLLLSAAFIEAITEVAALRPRKEQLAVAKKLIEVGELMLEHDLSDSNTEH